GSLCNCIQYFITPTCILTQIDLRPLSVIAVVAVEVSKHPIRPLVIMLINYVNAQFTTNLPSPLKIISVRERSGSSNKLYLRIFLPNCILYHLETYLKLRSDLLLISYPDILEIEWLNPSGRSPYRAPFAISRTFSPFYQVQYILNIGIHIFHVYRLLTRSTDNLGTA